MVSLVSKQEESGLPSIAGDGAWIGDGASDAEGDVVGDVVGDDTGDDTGVKQRKNTLLEEEFWAKL